MNSWFKSGDAHSSPKEVVEGLSDLLKQLFIHRLTIVQ